MADCIRPTLAGAISIESPKHFCLFVTPRASEAPSLPLDLDKG
jgi:hypothetical protein